MNDKKKFRNEDELINYYEMKARDYNDSFEDDDGFDLDLELNNY
jgi:hypothetical protein